ncbi:M48 family metallopeptidase [Leeia oryzae]|uniref:M48 family metallopeptidase n=1 Tax=Leeia oryzae TaxID=356662 RepID=UPI00036952F2|nr:M48 family metallopeptidase [Leeia oryzae]
MSHLKYLTGYPPHLLQQVQKLVEEDKLKPYLAQRYPATHQIQSDRALYDYANNLKQTYLKNAPPIDKVYFDSTLGLTHHALGLHTTASRVQGSRLKTKKEIRIASLFRQAAPEFLEMIVVHELAHFKEKEHGKAFYKLCEHMLPGYHQIEFDLRLYLTLLDA